MATKMQIRKILKDIDGIEIRGAGERWEVEVVGTKFFESASLEQDVHMGEINEKVCKALKLAGVRWGGYIAGWGGLIIRHDYESKGDWNDRSSKHHY